MIPAGQNVTYICLPCSRTPNPKLGRVTTDSAIRAARAHGCVSTLKPRTREGRLYQKWYLPREGSPADWALVWNSLGRDKETAEPCRHGCGHAEGAHRFSPVFQDDCEANCTRCGS